MVQGVRSIPGSRSSDVPVIRSRAFMLESMRMPGYLNNLLREDLKDMIPKVDCKGGERLEGARHAPIVSVNDLARDNVDGDTVRIDLFHHLIGLPQMCCEPSEGFEEDMTWASFELRIAQSKKAVKTGCTMDRLRMGNDLWMRAKPMLQQYWCKLEHERTLYHLAGTRGHYFNQADMLLPLETNQKFDSYMINCLFPPTYCRHFYGGDADSLSDEHGDSPIEAQDTFDLDALSRIAASMAEDAHPILPIRLKGDLGDPFWLLLVTPAQWHSFQLSTDGKEWASLLAHAVERAKACSGNHPLFTGGCLMYENILVRKYSPPVRFYPVMRTQVSCKDRAATPMAITIPGANDFYIDRAILLGGQALAEAYGSVQDADGENLKKLNFLFKKQSFDYGEYAGVLIKWVSGMKKIRFPDKFGWVYDRGVAVLDTAVPRNLVKCGQGGM